MRKILLLTITSVIFIASCCFSMTVDSTTGYGYVSDQDGNIIQKLKCQVGQVITQDGTWTNCTFEEWINISEKHYNPQTLKLWALQQNFAAEIMAHMAAFLDFANIANDESKSIFLTYAASVGLTDTANLIVDKAIELGAEISA